jgi:flagellar hook-associated protein 3 FlgL
MRISTSQMYDMSVARMSEQQNALNKTQQQVSTGRRILTPSDDPAASASAVQVSQLDTMNAQFQKNRDYAKNSLGIEDGILQQVSDLIVNAKSLATSAGNGTLANSDRADIATELKGQLQQLLGLANSKDGAGNYLFAGTQSTTLPFSLSGTAVQYAGDSGARALQVSTSRQLAVNDSGQQMFMAVPAGNGVFSAAATSTNTGTGVVSGGSLVDSSLLTGHNYSLNFSVAGGVTTYSVVDTTSGTTVSSGNPYTSGDSITVAGMQVAVNGSPANGDQFSMTSGAKQSLFQTMQNLIDVLSAPVTTAADSAKLTNGLNAALSNLDGGLNRILETRATVGSSLKELDTLDTMGSDLHIQYQQNISQLQDLDYTKALSDLSLQQTTLEAAQKSFVQVMGMSLFKFL